MTAAALPPDTLLHPHWYRVAALQPRLRGHLRVQRQITRGERWMLLTDGLTQRTHRLDAAAWALIGRCNGERTVQQLWETLLDEQGEDAPTQGEVIDLLAHLQQAGLLQAPIDAATGQPARPDHDWPTQRPRALVHAANPLYFQVTLGDPSALVRWLERGLRPLLQPALLVLWALRSGRPDWRRWPTGPPCPPTPATGSATRTTSACCGRSIR